MIAPGFGPRDEDRDWDRKDFPGPDRERPGIGMLWYYGPNDDDSDDDAPEGPDYDEPGWEPLTLSLGPDDDRYNGGTDDPEDGPGYEGPPDYAWCISLGPNDEDSYSTPYGPDNPESGPGNMPGSNDRP